MNSNMWSWVVLGLFGTGACFHDPSVLGEAGTPRVVSVTVRDEAGSAWPIASAPRQPRLELALEYELAEQRSSLPLYLIRGLADDELIDDLADPPWRADTTALLLPLSIERSAQAIRISPSTALEPGARYALVWVTAEDPQVFALQVSNSPAAGAALVQTLPSFLARDVPTNLRRGLLRFDGHLSAKPKVTMTGAQGVPTELEVTVTDCQATGFPAGDCIWLRWSRDLTPQNLYTIAITTMVHDATGAPVSVPSLTFETAAQPDLSPPALAQIPCALDEQGQANTCTLGMEGSLTLRAQVDEPVLAELLALPVRSAVIGMLDALKIELTNLPPDNLCRFLRLSDLAENELEIPLCGALPSDLATVTIDEVRADPLGPEPAQEYVELRNFGTKAVAMEGFFLTDDAFTPGHALSMPSALLPGERILVVGPDFDRHDPSDGAVPDSLRLLRLESPLSIANEGSALFLRDAMGRRLAAAPRLAPGRAGQCAARLSTSTPRSDDARDFALDPDGGCTPGTATSDGPLAGRGHEGAPGP